MELKGQAISDLRRLVANTLDVSEAEVTLDSGPTTLAKWDSFNHVQLMVAIEERYKIELDGDQIAEMMSVRDIAKVLAEKGVALA